MATKKKKPKKKAVSGSGIKSFVGEIPQPIPNTNQVHDAVIPDYLTTVQVSDTGAKFLLKANNFRSFELADSINAGLPLTFTVTAPFDRNFRINSLIVVATRAAAVFQAGSYIKIYINGFLLETKDLSGLVSPVTFTDQIIPFTFIEAPTEIQCICYMAGAGGALYSEERVFITGFYLE